MGSLAGNVRQRYSTTKVENISSNGRLNTSHKLSQKSLKELLQDSSPAVTSGLCLILAGTVLLFWNEGQAVHTARTLDEGFNVVKRLLHSASVDPENDGKLVHITGTLTVPFPLVDSTYGVRVKAVRLKRRVQVYQWIEEESVLSDSPNHLPEHDSTFTYSQTWKDKLVDSTSFYIIWGHENPREIPVEAQVRTATAAQVGVYELSPAVKEVFTKFTPVSGDEEPGREDIKLHSGMYYLTKDIFNPQTGDTRIQFYFSGHDGELVTIVAKQEGQTLHPFVTSSGRELLIIRPGKLSAEEMFSSEHAQGRLITWVNRFCGWFLILLGSTCLSSVTQYFMVFSPLFRDIIFMGIGSANLTLSMSLSMLLIGGAWCFYRPGMALFILMVATTPLFRGAMRTRNSSYRRPQRRTQLKVGNV